MRSASRWFYYTDILWCTFSKMRNFISEYFPNTVKKIKISLNKTRMTATLLEDQYTFTAHFLLKWNMFQKSGRECQNTHLMSNNFVFRKLCRLWGNAKKYCSSGRAVDDNMAHALQKHTHIMYCLCFPITTLVTLTCHFPLIHSYSTGRLGG
jgi:hypothetical protein